MHYNKKTQLPCLINNQNSSLSIIPPPSLEMCLSILISNHCHKKNLILYC